MALADVSARITGNSKKFVEDAAVRKVAMSSYRFG
jgi:hypothetical protein